MFITAFFSIIFCLLLFLYIVCLLIARFYEFLQSSTCPQPISLNSYQQMNVKMAAGGECEKMGHSLGVSCEKGEMVRRCEAPEEDKA